MAVLSHICMVCAFLVAKFNLLQFLNNTPYCCKRKGLLNTTTKTRNISFLLFIKYCQRKAKNKKTTKIPDWKLRSI
jgi:hypothetical protein